MDNETESQEELVDPIKALETREAEVARREKLLGAKGELERRGLPQALLPIVPLDDTGALDEVEKAFRGAVEQAVTEKLKGRAPVLGSQDGEQDAALRRAFGLK